MSGPLGLTLNLWTTVIHGGIGGAPLNALTLGGQPLTLGGDYLTVGDGAFIFSNPTMSGLLALLYEDF